MNHRKAINQLQLFSNKEESFGMSIAQHTINQTTPGLSNLMYVSFVIYNFETFSPMFKSNLCNRIVYQPGDSTPKLQRIAMRVLS